ncbi:MAG: DUF2249 domain-containing protein [Rhizobiales bacterium]|jgi:uncharacterized protein (DUF2249 family)|nr:DUF2249 domain-containing protein [Hyphomicrobiales bacterium]
MPGIETDTDMERVIKVAEIDPRHRHTVIMQLFAHLEPGHSLQLVTDHDPRPLRFQLETQHGSRCHWQYLEQGPDVWRVRLRFASRSDGSDV